MGSLDPRIETQLRQMHDQRLSQGQLLSKENRAASFEAFRLKFGPERLRSLDGPELLQVMHTHGNKDSLVYWIEYKDDEEFAGAHFGGISGGSAHVYGIFRRSGTDQWVKGSPRSEENITEDEAIEIARRHRDQLLAGSALLQELPPLASDVAYLELQRAMEESAPDLARRAWVHKYFFVLFPDKLDDFHNEAWQRYHLMKLLLEPPTEEGLYVAGGRFIRLATELGWSVDALTNTLNALNGKPQPYWRVGTRISATHSVWKAMKDGNFAAVGWDRFGDLSEVANCGDPKEKKAALIALQEKYYPADPRRVSREAGELVNFISTISDNDIVIAGDGETVLGIGRVMGPYYYDSSEPKIAPHRRPIKWLSLDQWKLRIPDGPRTTIWQLRKMPNLLEIEQRLHQIPQDSIPSKEQGGEVKLPSTVKPRLEGTPGRILGILERKGQAILYGPPGTGKTYWARKTALDVAAIERYGHLFQDLSREDQAVVQGDESQPGLVRFCTFHPAYGYEDFLEGYRPLSGSSGQLAFHLRDGIFKDLCDDARKAPDHKFILLIDEINRGDIPRIFGELLTLLELDKRGFSLTLPLSGKRFDVPKNVYVLGTMNTADRSIALLDTALRRRFGFIELMPDYSVFDRAVVDGPTALPLAPWLKALNERIRNHLGRDGRNLQVGHAYFLNEVGKPVTNLSKLVRILADDVIPLLEEYCYEDYSSLSRILGEQLVDCQRQCIKDELFAADRREELVKALIAIAPDIATTPEATSPDMIPEDSEDAEGEEAEDAET